MANHYDPNAMRTLSGNLKRQITEFRAARTGIETIVKSLHTAWEDDVNRKFSQTYLSGGAVQAERLEQLMEKYADLLAECAKRYGSAIDNGNTYLTSF